MDVNNSSVNFYDANLKVSHRFDDNNQLVLSSHTAFDDFQFSNEFTFDYRTHVIDLSYRKAINSSLFGEFSATWSEYTSAQEELSPVTAASRLETRVSYAKANATIEYNRTAKSRYDFGIGSTFYKVRPGEFTPLNEESLTIPRSVTPEFGLESYVFANNERTITPSLSAIVGFRGVIYQNLGPGIVNTYTDNDPANGQLLRQQEASAGEVIEQYFSFEPRASFRYKTGANSSIKGSYSRMVQYINQLSNLLAATPSSIWQLSNNNIEPSRAHNFSLGYFITTARPHVDISAEAFYRDIDVLYDFRDFADLIANSFVETELLQGKGRAYGLEISLDHKSGRFSTSVNYTWSRTQNRISGINAGEWYNNNNDKPHTLSTLVNWDLPGRNTLTLNYNFSTGRPTTVPVGSFQQGASTIPVFTDRNAARLNNFQRLDVSFTSGKGYKKSKKIRSSWTFAIYNLLGTDNPYSLFFEPNSIGELVPSQVTILGNPFPSISFNLEFNQ